MNSPSETLMPCLELMWARPWNFLGCSHPGAWHSWKSASAETSFWRSVPSQSSCQARAINAIAVFQRFAQVVGP